MAMATCRNCVLRCSSRNKEYTLLMSSTSTSVPWESAVDYHSNHNLLWLVPFSFGM